MKNLPIFAVLAALIFAPATANAERRGIELLGGLSPERLAAIIQSITEDPKAYQNLVSMGKCAQESLTNDEMKMFRAFSETASHNVRRHCDENRSNKAARYAKERFEEYTKTQSFESLSGCVKTAEDANTLTHLIMSQMGVKSKNFNEANICNAFEK